jgi:hypothetical protein
MSRSLSTPTSHKHPIDHDYIVRLIPLLAAVLVSLASCGATHDHAADDRAIAIYSAVVRVLITAPAGEPPTTAPSGPVFVVAADPRTRISLEVQAGVADALHSLATIRFLDNRSEALDTTEPSQPVHNGGVLITLATVPPGDTAVTIDALRYERVDKATPFKISLERVGSTWKPIATTAT